MASHKGMKWSEEARKRNTGVGHACHSKPHTPEAKLKISLAKRGKRPWNYIEDRSKVKLQTERNNPEYKQWRMKVWMRDGFKCKIANESCEGKIEAHHILGWSSYPELRYEINNGITLCHAHHPKKRAEEKRLTPVFQELVAVSNKK